MIDSAAIFMSRGLDIAAQRQEGVNDNMSMGHFHNFFEFYFLEEGSRWFMISGSLFEIKPGSLVILPPHTMHYSYGDQDKPFKRIVVYFTKESVPEDLGRIFFNLSGVFSFNHEEEARFIRSLFEKLEAEEGIADPIHQSMQRSLLHVLIGKILRAGRQVAKPVNLGKIKKIIGYLSDHYNEDISLDDLSARFFMSKFHLCREFKKFTKNTIIEYLNHIRILHAQRLFMESDHNLSQIAKEVGFSSLTHFERTFRKIAGVSPNESKKALTRQKLHNADLRPF